jgi:hypothetical protein
MKIFMTLLLGVGIESKQDRHRLDGSGTQGSACGAQPRGRVSTASRNAAR